MSAISLFGACDMTPASFASMAPHVQTEAVLLMTEACYGVGAIEKITGAPRSVLLSAYRKAHQFKARDEDRAGPTKGPKIGAMSASARLVLLMMQNQAGTLAASLGSIGYDIGKSESSVRDALKFLTARELIEMTQPSRGNNHPAEYRMTAAGEAQAALLSEQTGTAAHA